MKPTSGVFLEKTRCVYPITALFGLILISACSNQKEGMAEAHQSWEMHIIDNTSFGSDGTKVYDVNGDGYEDIVCGWEQGQVARLYINPVDNDQWPYIEVPAPDVEDALMMDIDGDGFMDMVTFSEGQHQRIAFHWAPPDREKYLDSSQWRSEDVPITVGKTQWMFGRPMQIDGKNGMDIVVAAKNDGAMVGWLQSPENPRDVNAWKLYEITPASWVMSVEVIDINHDGTQDILISDRNGSTNGVKWLEHPGMDSETLFLSWQEHLIGMKGRDPMFLAVAPINEEGWLEIWVPDLRKELFHFVQVDKTGANWRPESINFPTQSGLIGKSAAIGDIDGDGRKDLVTTYDGAENRSGVMWSAFDEENQAYRHYDVSGPLGNKYDFAYLIDLDRDGDLDILTSEENNNSSTVAGLGVVWYENPYSRK